MNKYLIYITLLTFVVFATPMLAQEVDPAVLQAKIRELNDTIGKKDKEIKQLKAQLEGEGMAKERIKTLQEKLNSASTDIRNLQQKKADLQDTIQQKNLVINDLRPKIKQLNSENEQLKKYKTQVEPLVQRQLSSMATGIGQKWLNKTFAEINQNELADELKLYEDFKDKDKGVASAYNTLKVFDADYHLYLRGVDAINSPYEADVIISLIQPIKELKDREKNNGRKAEIEQLFVQLSDYKITVSYFQRDIIGEIDNMLKGFKQDGTHKKAWKQIKVFLDEKDNGQVEKYMTEIPWIGEQYRLYIMQLENNPYATNPVRETIMNLVP